jgi:hypothetical protein
MIKTKEKRNWRKEGSIRGRQRGRIYFVKGTTVFSTAMKRRRK